MCWLFVCFVILINAGSVEHVAKYSIKYYFYSPTCLVTTVTIIMWLMIRIVNKQIIVLKYINPLNGKFELQIKCNIIIFLNYLYIDCILVVSHSDYGRNCDRNMLMKINDM